MKNRYFIILSYFGKNYHGWQIQPNASSIQETLNAALSKLFREPIYCAGAGRTDTGVHASYYVAHFDCLLQIENKGNDWIYKINCILPDDIAVKKIIKVSSDKHARFDAISRTYNYFITTIKDPFYSETSYFFNRNLDVDLMNKACELLMQHSDFTSFSKLHTDTKTNNCKLYEANWEQKENKIIFTIKADRFLRNMVRAIVGTMLEIGTHKISLEDFSNIIESKNRSNAGKSIDAKGLFLSEIEYPHEII